MTLQNGMIWRDEVRLYCDTAWLSVPSGEVVMFYPKAIYGLTQPYAITGTIIEPGDGWQGIEGLGKALGSFGVNGPRSSAELVWSCADWLAAAAERVNSARLLIGCNYPDTGPELLLIATDDLGFTAPFVPVQVASFASSANDSAEYQDAAANGFDKRRMLALIDRQRRTPFDTAGHGVMYGIGGAAVEIRVKRTGVESSVVRQWNDRIGEVIRP